MGIKLRDRKSGWEELNASGENAKTRDVYNSQQFGRSTIDKPQTMTTRMIIIVMATVLTVIFMWFILSFVQFGMASFRGMNGTADGSGTVISDNTGTGQGGELASDPTLTPEQQELRRIQNMDWETYLETYYVKLADNGSMVHMYQSRVNGGQYGMTAIYDGYCAMRNGDYDSYAAMHVYDGTPVITEPAEDPDAGTQATSPGFDAIERMDFDTYRSTFYTKEGSEYLSHGDGLYYGASDVYDNYMALVNGDYVLYAKLHGALEQPAQDGVGSDANPDVSGEQGAVPNTPDTDVQGEPGVPVMAPAAPDTGVDGNASSDAQGGSQAGTGTESGFGSQQAQAGGKNYFLDFSMWKVMMTLFSGLIVFAFLYVYFRKNLDAQNQLTNTSYLNQYHNDQHVQLPEEVQRNYDWFPDVGAHAPVQVSSMISHAMLDNKGIKTVLLTKRAKKDILDDNGDVVYYKGEALLDDDGNPLIEEVPLFDKDFGHGLFESASVVDPGDVKISLMDRMKGKSPPENYRVFYNAKEIPYNPGDKNRDKLKGAETVADMINKYWEFPEYEPQRPAGAYIIDTAPVNTMLLAITRAGKGQTVIEPTLDMWTREMRPNNMVINDPKGELLVKFYVKGTIRGFQIVQFNLINSMKTDIYNPLGMAADAAREGDFMKVAQYVENIAEVFFPVDGGDDPVWPNAANNAFKRAAYGLIDFYLEEEKEVRIRAAREHWDDKTLETWIDTMWGKVTLYNCYQLFVQLTSKKLKNPVVEFKNREKNGDFDELKPDEDPDNLPPGREPLTDDEYEARKQKVLADSVLWEDKPDADLLTLFFNATAGLPMNSMRRLISNCNNALRSMAGAEKMLSSVYGIAITAMVRRVSYSKRNSGNQDSLNWRPDGRNEGVTPGNVRAETPTCLRKGNLVGAKLGKVGFEI